MFENFVRNNVVVLTALDNDYEKVITNNRNLLSLLDYRESPDIYVVINRCIDGESRMTGYFKKYSTEEAMNPKYLFDLLIQDIRSEFEKDPLFISNIDEENIFEFKEMVKSFQEVRTELKQAEHLQKGYHQLVETFKKDSNYFDDVHQFYKFYEEYFTINGQKVVTAREMGDIIEKINSNYDYCFLHVTKMPYRFKIEGSQMFLNVLNRLAKDLLIKNEDVYNFSYTVKGNKILLEIEVMNVDTMQNTWYRRVADFLDLFYKHGIGAIHVIPQHGTFDN